MKTYLGKRGYIIYKKEFDFNKLQEIKNELTVQPYVPEDYKNNQVEKFKVYGENKNKMYLPKFYGIEKLGPPDEIKIPRGLDANLDFIGTLRPNQIEPYNTTMKALNNYGGGILSLPCGYGKTALSLYIASQFKLKTLVIVHKTFLLNQWKDRIKEFMPNAKIGIIQQKTVDTDDKDIVIGMLQSISMKEYAMTTFDCFGMLIIDECHRISSKVYSKALRKTNCTYMLALSATPTRKDGLTKVLKWHVGDIVFSIKRKGGSEVNVERFIINSDNEAYNQELVNFRGKPNMPKMINNITEYMNRTFLIVNRIKELINEKRRILLLSDRRNHLADIFKLVEQQNICSVGYYVGGMKEKDLKISSEMELILGTFSMANEGLDIPALNTLILASPKSDIIQASGRILRKAHVDIKPLIIDYVDNFSMFAGQARKRYKYFQGKKYNITNIEITDEGDILSRKEYTKPERKNKKKIDITSNCLFSGI